MIVVCGESLVDLVSEPVGTDGIVRLVAHAGGSPYNCARALARLGSATAFMCPISRDGFGDLLRRPLLADGVQLCLTDPVAAPTSLAVVTLNDKGQAQYEFYRSADRMFSAEGLVAALPAELRLLQIGGFCPILMEDAKAWLKTADVALSRGALVSIDPNVRPGLVHDFDSYKQRLGQFFDRAHLVKVSDEDLAALDPDLSVEDHAEALLARANCELVIVTLGEGGTRAFNAKGAARAPIYAPPQFGDTVGAGDSMMAGTLTALAELDALQPGRLAALDGETLTDVLRFGAVVAGLNCAKKGCHPPSRAQVDAVIAAS
jgi:fructokinase